MPDETIRRDFEPGEVEIKIQILQTEPKLHCELKSPQTQLGRVCHIHPASSLAALKASHVALFISHEASACHQVHLARSMSMLSAIRIKLIYAYSSRTSVKLLGAQNVYESLRF